MNRQEAVNLMAGNTKAAMQLLKKCEELSREWEIPFEFVLTSDVDDDNYQSDSSAEWQSSNC